MDKLIKKIIEINNLLKFIKQVKENPLVPTPKMPGVKKLGSIKAQKPTKIPGIAPNALKDPIKVSQQLKNPAPKKPKINILKTASNGQWELLEKAVWEHAPHIQPQNCKCSGATKGDNMHHYSCVDANSMPSPKLASNPDHAHVEKFLNSLNDEAKKKYGDGTAQHFIVGPDQGGIGVSDHSKEIEIHHDFGDTSEPDHFGHDNWDEFDGHMQDHLDRTHTFMDSLGYEPYDEVDGSGSGLNYSSTAYRKKQ
jgi:hypothetical protein